MSLFRKKSDIPEEQALLAAMDDMRNRPKDPLGVEDVRDDDDAAHTGDDAAEDARNGEAGDSGPRLDFGALKVPAVDGMQLRVEMDEAEQPVAVAVMLDDTVLQMQVFAAPRSEALWDEVRQEIAEGIRGSQGKARETDGTFGRELQAEVVVADESGKTTRQAARFIGIDGERWFLRGVVTGAGATDPSKAAAVEKIFSAVVVDRGTYAAAPRNPLELSIPDDPALVGEPPEDGQ